MEIIIVIAIITIIIGVSTTVYSNFRSSYNLDFSVSGIIQAARLAQANAQKIRGDSAWGIEIYNDKVVVFNGSNYGARDMALDQSISLPGGIIVSGLNEVIFTRLSGNTTNTGTITITNNEGSTKNISINEKGTLTY